MWNEKFFLDETKQTMGCRDAKISCIHACTYAICEEAMVLGRTDRMSSL